MHANELSSPAQETDTQKHGFNDIMAAQAFHSDNSTEDFDAHNLETG